MNALVIHEGKNITEKKIPNLLYEKFGWTNLFYFNNLKKTGLMGDNLCRTDFASHQKITLKVTLKDN